MVAEAWNKTAGRFAPGQSKTGLYLFVFRNLVNVNAQIHIVGFSRLPLLFCSPPYLIQRFQVQGNTGRHSHLANVTIDRVQDYFEIGNK